MSSVKEHIIDRLDRLPEDDLREVLSFVEVLAQRTGEREDPVLSVAGILSGESLTADQIEQELYRSDER